MKEKILPPAVIRMMTYRTLVPEIIDDIELDFTYEGGHVYRNWEIKYYYAKQLIATKYYTKKLNRKEALDLIKKDLEKGKVHDKVYKIICKKRERLELKYGIPGTETIGTKGRKPY